ncbi:hypothetical protein RhiirA1_461585 [Rhizophagus irregularis]|uniref:Uncharacterized protein n=1 Tax=Rhizophagus irregularis TaxID=588596 RepID=A0A2N0RP22_9GLOM|nr:hypothetical protein RhiirA1_461585 [Rhizophagus irregularis]
MILAIVITTPFKLYLFLDLFGDFIEGSRRITPTTPQNSLGANQKVLDLSIPTRDSYTT